MKFQTNRVVFSEYAYQMAEKYQMGLLVAEYHVTFSLFDKIQIAAKTIFLALLFVILFYSIFLVRNMLVSEIFFSLFLLGDIIAILLLSFCYVLWLLYQRQRYRLRSTTYLVVYERGIISVGRDVIVIYWQQIQQYKKWKIYFYAQVMLILSDGRTVYFKNIFDNFNNFIRLLKENINS